jgi:hypothetical protein
VDLVDRDVLGPEDFFGCAAGRLMGRLGSYRSLSAFCSHSTAPPGNREREHAWIEVDELVSPDPKFKKIFLAEIGLVHT